MIYKVSYVFKGASKDDGKDEAKVTVVGLAEADVTSSTLSGEVFVDNKDGGFLLFVEASSPEEALDEAESEFVHFFFKVLARTECEADGQNSKELYLIAEERDAYHHRWGEGSSYTEKDEPLNVFVLNRQGLERW